ncbi:methyltransferase family protein [Allomuricauda sp. SCSIO 65647]|uniref:methyltransferase family protein n=1 Tax=Allomuricauda sp. SCSIO 65647 TaxID=2908843 RepID=UPI001F361B1E|nr:isoprenylcysteine carboxylmethyltransferase family protein [Muricauda sp. SCSIO 65647]UJH69086.1 isoprenylcysteine carboxylmethyltransferase family protein [Muricauda sp. SCSIO 65647]
MKPPSTAEIVKAIFLLPFMVTVVIPFLMYGLSSNFLPSFFSSINKSALFATGMLLLGIGLVLFISSVVLFVRIGKGTLAPWNPTRKLVVKSLYRHMRNPMILGVLCILLGESLLLASFTILVWAIFFFVLNHCYFIWKEEPDLTKRFGEEYKIYKKNVPRWLPRIKGWYPEKEKPV